jgi:hypothetical protein
MNSMNEGLTESSDGTLDMVLECRPFKEIVTPSLPIKGTLHQSVMCASRRFRMDLRVISIFGQQRDRNGLFVDCIEPGAALLSQATSLFRAAGGLGLKG